VDQISESAAQAARDVRVVFSRLRRRLMNVGSTEDLTPSQTAVLIRLAKGGASSTSELAGAEQVRPQSMATTLAGLDRHGLIERRPDPDDGRRQVIALTPAGREHAESGRRASQEWLDRAMQNSFTEAERAVILAALALLERLTEH
jgi:DNA-binding MarR family transcriptional regulator